MKSKWLKVLAVACLIGLLAAIPAFAYTKDQTDWASQMKAKYGGMTVTAAFCSHPVTEAMQQMASDFTKLTGINVKWDVMEEGYLRNKLLIEHQGKTGVYDVLLIDAFSLSEYAPAGVAVDLKPFINNKALTPDWYDYVDIMSAYRDGIGRYQGVIYGIPVAGETRYIGYRKDLFQKYNKKPPTTMDELLELAKFFNGRETKLYGIAMRAQKGIHWSSGFMTTMYNNGGQILDQKTWKSLIGDPKTAKAFKYHIELLKQAPPDVGVYTHEEAISAFSTGRTAMWFDSTALTPWILDPDKSLVTDKVGFVPPPKGAGGAYGALAGWDVGISSDIPQKRREAAWAFVVWMTSKANAKQYVGLGGTAVRKSVMTDPDMVAKNWTLPIQMESLERAGNMVEDGILWLPPHGKFLKIIESLGSYGSQVLSGQMDADDAIKAAQKDAERILAEK